MSRRASWSEQDTARARELLAEHGSYTAVARIMGRNITTVSDWLQGRRGNGSALRVIKNEDMHIPSHVLADRERRKNLEPASVTAAFFGDPLPGYSALERR
jgi:transposase-like protein